MACIDEVKNNHIMFRDKIAQEIERIERKITEFESKLDIIFKSSSPEDDGVMEMVMSLAEKITYLKDKKEKLKQTFWSLI